MVQTSKNLQQNGKFHLIVCRYLLEHSHNPVEALQSLKHLIHLDGFLLIEVPDNTKFLQCKDYSFIWEEHITYFNEYTLENLLSVSGYEMVVVLKFTGKLEDALVAIVKPSSNPQLDFKKNTPISRFDEYRNSFEDIKKNYITQLEKMKKNGDIIVIFGAGHQSIMFINALKLVPYISFIIDDDINKQGYFSPGSNIPIVDSSILLGKNSDINVCLLAVSPKLEEKIQAKLKPFTKRSGKLYTIFPGSNMPTIFEDNICN
jgi:hypothetical protein